MNYDNGFAKAQASYEARTDDDLYSGSEDNSNEYEEPDSMYEIDRAEEIYRRIKNGSR